MAERIGVTVTQVRRWERGVIELDAEARERWNREVTVGDPWFKFQTSFDFAKELYERSEKQRRELADLNERMTQLEERNSTLEELTRSLKRADR
jgi:transcriptional regulator with XRE-family HTH domain